VEVITPFTDMKIVWETTKLPDWPNPTLGSLAEKLSYLAVTSLSGKMGSQLYAVGHHGYITRIFLDSAPASDLS